MDGPFYTLSLGRKKELWIIFSYKSRIDTDSNFQKFKKKE